MGSAASSALRIDETAYGSLEGLGSGLGGVRKFKKQPVLVLDPEELAQAHAAFHEASAEQLGETVERAPKPAMILGLAPMDDDDLEEMGEADDVGEDADTGQPSAEAVLSLTRRKSTPLLDEDDAPAFDDGFIEPHLPHAGNQERRLSRTGRHSSSRAACRTGATGTSACPAGRAESDRA